MDEIEAQAGSLLAALPAYVWDGERLPVPVEHVADSHFGLLVRDIDEMDEAPGCPPLGPGQSLSGLLLADRREIWVNATEARAWPERRRFTIAHELGHWCLHRTADEHAVYCRHALVAEEPAPQAGERPPLPLAEEQANVFAAALLMPAALLRAAYQQDRDFDALCARFGVSRKAMGRRLHAVV